MKKRESFKELSASDTKSIYRRIYKDKKGRHIDDLMSPEWGGLFPETGGEKKFYVYAHIQPSTKSMGINHPSLGRKLYFTGVPFYIGKGCARRAWDLGRNEGHGAQLKGLLARGFDAEKIVHILRDGMTESEAFTLESKLIYLLGTKFELGTKGLLVNLDLPKRPIHLI